MGILFNAQNYPHVDTCNNILKNKDKRGKNIFNTQR